MKHAMITPVIKRCADAKATNCATHYELENRLSLCSYSDLKYNVSNSTNNA